MSSLIINEKMPTELKTADFFYNLPHELIAQHPSDKRDESRLLVINRKNEQIEHKHFFNIIDYINSNDVLVINDSKVIPARIYGKTCKTTTSDVELLLLRSQSLDTWECLTKPGKKAKIGSKFVFGDDLLYGEVLEIVTGGNRIVKFDYDKNVFKNIYEVLNIIGLMPLPPYITEKPKDYSRYQTVYAREEGSAAAPTAGLHFTPQLLDKLKEKGIAAVPVMLHVGLGTFRPVKCDRVDEHVMHTEYFSVSEESAKIINERRAAGGKVICVGTTSARVLESVADENGIVHPCSGDTGIFIYPGYKFKIVDTLITNFHLPESSLLMLVSAFYTREAMLRAYTVATEEKYRFFSFGDAMIIL